MSSYIEEILYYIEQDSEHARRLFESYIADYFDLKNRTTKPSKAEINWIKKNFTKKNQSRIFGKTL